MSDSPKPTKALVISPNPTEEHFSALGELVNCEFQNSKPEEFLEGKHNSANEFELYVISSNRLDLKTLYELARTIRKLQKKCIVVVGDRGLAGFEDLSLWTGFHVLPSPWTIEGFQKAVRGCLNKKAPPKEVELPSEEYFETMGESMLDLTSGFSWIEEIKEREPQAYDILQKTRTRLGLSIEVIALLGNSMRPHHSQIEHKSIVEETHAKLLESGLEIKLGPCAAGSFQGDFRYMAASLCQAAIYLDKFGTGGTPTLSIESDKSGHAFIQLLLASDQASGDTKPPIFLLSILEALLLKAGLELDLGATASGIPYRIKIPLVK